MKKVKMTTVLLSLSLALVCVFGLFGCGDGKQGEGGSDSGSAPEITEKEFDVYACEVAVGETQKLEIRGTAAHETITYSYDAKNIRIDAASNSVKGLLAGTVTEVTATTASGKTDTFKISVDADVYTGGVKNDEVESKVDGAVTLYNDVSVNAVEGLREDFPLGIDISTIQRTLDLGGKYYNASGICQDVYTILKDNGVNYVRIRLWNDPYERGADGAVISAYGGGYCDLNSVLAMAKDAKLAGLKILLDFHYSDFWADPSDQIFPKAWAVETTSDGVARLLSEYTTDVLSRLKSVGAAPDMVQVGNEITNGLLTQLPGNGSGYTGYQSKSTASAAVRGTYSENGDNAVFLKYVNAGCDAVKTFDQNIQVVLHIAKGMTGTSYIKNFFDTVADVNYDIIGLSFYPWIQGNISSLRNAVGYLNTNFPTKKVAIMETSYAYTYAGDGAAECDFNAEKALSGYDVSVQGQANFIRDVIAAVASSENGYGVFCWEGCWIPMAGSGWADDTTKNTWANQAFFSYGGKVLPSLSVFNRVRGV